MAITKDQKAVILKELVEKFGKSKSVVFADYRGLDVLGMSTLRAKLREKDAELKVAKKTLMGLAAKEHQVELRDDFMEGPVAATFSYEDPMVGIKILFNFAKENDKLKLLGGVIDGKVVGPEVIQEYATLPGREELLAKLLGSMNSPVSGTVGLLNNIIAGFVRVINAYKDTLPANDSAPSADKKEEKAEAPASAPEVAPAESASDTAEGEVKGDETAQ